MLQGDGATGHAAPHSHAVDGRLPPRQRARGQVHQQVDVGDIQTRRCRGMRAFQATLNKCFDRSIHVRFVQDFEDLYRNV